MDGMAAMARLQALLELKKHAKSDSLLVLLSQVNRSSSPYHASWKRNFRIVLLYELARIERHIKIGLV